MTIKNRKSDAGVRLRSSMLGTVGGLLILLLVFVAACGTDSVPAELRSIKERSTPTTTGTDVTELVNGNSGFAFDLYHALAANDGNLFYSPYSISSALSMVYAGAKGDTETQMADTLQFRLSQDALHPAFNSLDLALASRGQDAEGKDGEGFRLNVVNAVWGQHDYEFLDTFLDVLAESYGAGVRPIDFQAAPEEARSVINDWIADRTDDRVKDLIPPGLIHSLTRMVLTNAVYFNAAWEYPFHAALTQDQAFYLLDGGAIDVPMMNTEDELGYAYVDGYQVLDLPYDGGELSMTIMLPDRGRFREFEASLDAELARQAVESLESRYVDLRMPKFEFESQFRLGEQLKAMGMNKAFESSASDFSGMDGNSCIAGDDPCLYMEDVVHKAFVSVDEDGTEAAAATAVLMRIESARSQPIDVTVDRPFIFMIRDRATDAILFIGRVEKI